MTYKITKHIPSSCLNLKPSFIPFNRPTLAGNELEYIKQAVSNRHLSSNGPFTQKCHTWLEKNLHVQKALLTHSGSAALEMAALLIDVKPGDEIIMPAFTFVTTASAFVLRGATPVFVDIRPDTLNIDEKLIEGAITSKTKAVVAVHYAGISCDMDEILKTAAKSKIFVIEDAAHSILSSYKGQKAGSMGHLSTLSFHETKNIISGEGGALLINDAALIPKAHQIWEKGTNRMEFFEGKVDKYTWQTLGSSFAPSEITAAFLMAQLENAYELTEKRLYIWRKYNDAFEDLEQKGYLRRPLTFEDTTHNGHIYYLLVESPKKRSQLLDHFKKNEIGGIFHFIPLHQSPAGSKYTKIHGSLKHTEDLSSKLVRLPIWVGIDDSSIEYIIKSIHEFFKC